MYKIKSTVAEVKVLCEAYSKHRKVIVKNRRVKYIHKHANDTNIFGRKKYKSIKDLIRYMKKTGDMWGTIWFDLYVTGSYWDSKVKKLYTNINRLPDDKEIWLQEEMSFLFKYKDKE